MLAAGAAAHRDVVCYLLLIVGALFVFVSMLLCCFGDCNVFDVILLKFGDFDSIRQ